jgi:hypothetical protein
MENYLILDTPDKVIRYWFGNDDEKDGTSIDTLYLSIYLSIYIYSSINQCLYL